MAVMQVPIPMMEISHAKGADKKQNKQTKKPQRNKQRIEKKKSLQTLPDVPCEAQLFQLRTNLSNALEGLLYLDYSLSL